MPLLYIVSVASPTDCTSITGFSFNASTGVISFTPDSDGFDNGDASGRYELKVIATTSNGTDEDIFIITVNDIQTGPPGLADGEEWIKVPANAGGMGLPEFWVMKYEAKAWNDGDTDGVIDAGEVDADGQDGVTANWGLATHKPISIADNQPWRRIDANNAVLECDSLNTEAAQPGINNDTNADGTYGLITNDEWMAIARDVEAHADNWTGNSVGTGCLFRGNTGEATTGDGTNPADSCGYNAATDPEQGTGRDIRSKLILNSDPTQEIYDLAGNLLEWADWDDPTSSTAGFQIAPDTTACGSGELPSIACGALVDADFNTSNGGYTRTEGVGYFFGGAGGAAVRGGVWYSPAYSGAFNLYLGNSPTNANDTIGFRCVYRN